MSKQTRTTIRFELRTSKIDKQGKAPIRIVYQLQQQRKFYPTKLKCLPINWDTKEQQAIFINKPTAKRLEPDIDYELLLTAAEVKDFNKELLDYEQQIRDTEERFRLNGITYTPSMVLEALHNQQPQAKKDEEGKVVAFIRQFAQDSTGTIKPGTIKVYTGLAAHLVDYEKQSGKKATFQDMDIPYLRGFHAFLCTDRTIIRKDRRTKAEKKIKVPAMNNITAAKQLSTLKTLLNYARVHYKIDVNPGYRDYSITRKDSNFEVITLSREEFETLFYYDLSHNKRLAQVRDIFCFSCATSLRYSDLLQLKREHIRGGVIKMTAAKTGQPLEIPLNQYSAAILNKYKDAPSPLPISSKGTLMTGQRLNTYIKELGRLCNLDTPIPITREYGIKKVETTYPKYELLSIHTGRKTFITLSLEKDVPIQEVMSLSGHTTFKAVKRYIDVSARQKKAAMIKAWGDIPNEEKLRAV